MPRALGEKMRTIILVLALITIGAGSVVRPVPSDVVTIRALRLENNHAIASHNIALMRKSWTKNIRLIESDGTVYSGSASLAQSYADIEFKNAAFIAYARRPLNITISADGAQAAEYGKWTEIKKGPKRSHSGTYFASWRKYRGVWKIVYEAYVSLDHAP